MISKLPNDITLCKMGDGTLYSGVLNDEDGIPAGIAFTKTPDSTEGGVVFQINSMEGLTGYMLPIVSLMEAWQEAGIASGTEEELNLFFEGIREMKETLAPYMPKAKGVNPDA